MGLNSATAGTDRDVDVLPLTGEVEATPYAAGQILSVNGGFAMVG